ncbi:winged helix-turn-helix transcriptional regulator [Jongsikchunia kroppenstedtii]|uniref:winged helix-turn-helix transcriptional regulator n=1 Tax=Jongsikchunia kroppenstedtii TaxID=1121721 RepID=UPI00037AD116|nr:winged helix-turn-helix transcriptional regulator [Jongsikchunia kroppenstedtii]
MRSYRQYCSIARALDLIGDRWTLLIVRELLLRGPSRFTDLRNGLPGVAPNLLSTRLKELEESGLTRHEYAPSPVATQLYQLTADGLALEPVLRAIGLWGVRYMADEHSDDAFDANWLAYAPSWFTTDANPDGPPGVIQLDADGERAVIELGGGTVRTSVGDTDRADLTLTGPARAVLGLLVGQADLRLAEALGLTASGDVQLLDRLRPIRLSFVAAENGVH